MQRARWCLVLGVLGGVVGCAGDTATDFSLHLEHGGKKRTAYVHLPQNLDVTQPAPVVLNFHGYESDAKQQADYSRMNEKGAKRGFVVVHPEGLNHSWNGGKCCGRSQSGNVDDVGFVEALLDELRSHVAVDPKRIFSTGMSNGGFMTYRLACERPNLIAAIAPVAGANGMSRCSGDRAVPLLHIHGTKDGLVAYDGKGPYGFMGARESVEQWPGRMGCSGAFEETFRQGDAHCEKLSACNGGAEASLCTIDGGGHTWPGGQWFPLLGKVSQDLDASDRALDFFEAHPQP